MLTDSMAKYVQIKGAKVCAFRGDTIGRLADRIRFRSVDVTGYSRIFIHVGSNDISNLVSSGQIRQVNAVDVLRRFKSLRTIIRRRNSRASLLFSSILPRVKQFDLYKPYISGLNFALEKWCASSKGASVYIPSFQPFLVYGRPKTELYACDGLHLSGSGVELLEGCIQQALSTGYLLKRVSTRRVAKLASVTC